MASVDITVLQSVLQNSTAERYYIVKESDTFKSISQKVYGNVALYSFISMFNDMGSDDDLVIGQILEMPTLVDTLISDFDDRYGKDIRINSDGNLEISSSGDLLVVNGIENIIQHISLYLETAIGTYLHAINFGFTRYMGSTFNSVVLTLIDIELKNILLSDERVQEITEYNTTLTGDGLQIDAVLQTILSEKVIISKNIAII